MGQMVRKQIYIKLEQEKLLKQQAKELGVSEAELIRQSIERIGRTRAVLPLDQEAWQEELAFIYRRASQEAFGRQRSWTREDLYEERLQRLSR